MNAIKHPCVRGDGQRPCAEVAKCRLCWLYANDERYNRLWGGDGRVSRRPSEAVVWLSRPWRSRQCIHLGAETGERRQCGTCRGKVELKVFACGHPARGTATARDCRNCRDVTSVLRFDETNLAPGQPGKRFNSSLIAHGDEYALAYRDGWKGSQIHVATLDRDLKPVGTVLLRLNHVAASFGREDPRLFRFQGRLHVAFTGVVGGRSRLHTNVLYARLGDGFRVERIFAPRYARRNAWEKNWQFFEHDGQLLAIYSVAPHRILRIDGERTDLAHETPTAAPWRGGEMRGGAPPVRVGDEYWHFFHDRITVGQHVYRAGLCAFEARPPFRVTRMIPEPILVADRATKPADQYCSVVFPCGAVRRGGDWLVSFGIHDRWTEIRAFDHATLAAALRPLEGSA